MLNISLHRAFGIQLLGRSKTVSSTKNIIYIHMYIVGLSQLINTNTTLVNVKRIVNTNVQKVTKNINVFLLRLWANDNYMYM